MDYGLVGEKGGSEGWRQVIWRAWRGGAVRRQDGLTGARCDAATQRRARLVREDVIDGRRV